MRIHAITTGHVRIKQAQIEGRGHGLWRQLQPMLSPDWADWSPVYAFAIEHPEGVIVVDTGASVGLKKLPRWHPYFQLSVRFDIEAEQELGPQLRNLGIGARDVKTVVLTHLHIDHDGGLAHFPHSRMLASGEELARAVRYPRRHPRLSAEPLAKMVRSRAAVVAAVGLRTISAQRAYNEWGRYRGRTNTGPHARSLVSNRNRRRSTDHARGRCVLS